jgi:hypothetical protein
VGRSVDKYFLIVYNFIGGQQMTHSNSLERVQLLSRLATTISNMALIFIVFEGLYVAPRLIGSPEKFIEVLIGQFLVVMIIKNCLMLATEK